MTHRRGFNHVFIGVCAAALSAASIGCASSPDDPDPWEPMNRAFFTFNRGLEKAVGEPVARVYTTAAPEPVRDGLRNAFDNLSYLDVILNNFLQGKVRRGVGGVMRVVINSTLGIGGIFDVATELGLEEHNEDFGQTLGVWGAEPGPYLVLPVLGPTTLRDAPGRAMDAVLHPTFYINEAAVTIPIGATDATDRFARSRRRLERRDQAPEPYVFIRDGYLQRREALIRDRPLEQQRRRDAPEEGDESGAPKEEKGEG